MPFCTVRGRRELVRQAEPSGYQGACGIRGEKGAGYILSGSRDGRSTYRLWSRLMRMVKDTALIHDLEESRSEEELYQTVLNCEFEVL